jgi:FkbM family methyltransferase
MHKWHQKSRFWLAKYIPFIRPVKRFIHASQDTLATTRPSYAQHGEDVHIIRELAGLDLTKSIYIDVGANHPTRISNTYLLYRHGVSGIVVEPNKELLWLYQMCRPRDVVIGVGCGKEAALGSFHRHEASVLSTFSQSGTHANVHPNGPAQIMQVEYIPIFPLDLIVSGVVLSYNWICLLSIDTEGFDYEVLLGATQTLAKTLLVCVETNDPQDEQQMTTMLEQQNFTAIQKIGCNILLRNNNPLFHNDRR